MMVHWWELAVAIAADFPPSQSKFMEITSLRKEINEAIDYRVGTIVLDSLQEN